MNRRTFLLSLGIGLLSAPLLVKAATKSRRLGPVRFADCDNWDVEPAADGYAGFMVVREKVTRAVYRFGVKGANIYDRITMRGPVRVDSVDEVFVIPMRTIDEINRRVIKPFTVHVTWREWEEI